MRCALLRIFALCALPSLGCATTRVAKQSADASSRLCIVNARVRDEPAPRTIVAVDGRIAGLYGGEVGGCTERLDAEGGWVLGGFHDAHIHMMSGAVALTSADLSGATTLEEITSRVKAYAAAHPEQTWLIGRGWTFDAVPKPDKTMLAAVDPRPIFLESYDGHAAWVNAAALEAADATGGGLLLEDAMSSVEDRIPRQPRAIRQATLAAAVQHVLRLGITSVDDITTDPETLELYDALDEADALPIDVTVSLPLDGDLALYTRLREAHPELFGYLKGFVDGVIESKTAYLLAPYTQDASRGAPLIPAPRLRALVQAADAAGFRVALHCIGDAAVRMALDAFEGTHTPGHRIEHIELADPADLPRFADLNVTASMQPYHANPFGPTPDAGVWSENLGAARLPHTFPWRALLDAGATLRFGSDWPVMSADPLRGVAVAMTRQDEHGQPPNGWNAHQRVTRDEALRAYDSAPITVGAPANLVVLAPGADLDDPRTLWNVERRAVITRGVPRALH